MLDGGKGSIPRPFSDKGQFDSNWNLIFGEKEMYTVLDIECTTSNKGNPFDQTNKMVMIGVLQNEKVTIIKEEFEDLWVEGKLLVGHNIKFDIHWIRRCGVSIKDIKVWDTQLAEFILTGQDMRFPSLDGCLEKYGFPAKLDVVKTEYWNKGIDTDDIPTDILTEYLERDLKGTEEVYLAQKKLFETTHKHLLPLFKLHCKDLLVLEEMEFNGIRFNEEKARDKAEDINQQQLYIKDKLDERVGSIPYSLSSDTDISAIIYGGTILKESRIPIGEFKTGNKIGQTRYKVIYNSYDCVGMVTPLKNTESHEKVSQKEMVFVEKGILTKPRKYWKVDEKTLKKVKAKKIAREFITLFQEYNKLEKLRGTYLLGWSDFIHKLNLKKDTLHPQLNQCVAVTGRLSSSQPNGQNADSTTKRYCESRYL